MIKNAIQKHMVYNPENDNCPVCEVLNNIYNTDSFQKEMKISGELGEGYYRRIILKPTIEISVIDVTFHQSITMGGGQDHSLSCLSFCLGEGFQWRTQGDKKEYDIGRGESYIFKGNKPNGICNYMPGQRFFGLNILLDSDIVTKLIQHMGKENSSTGQTYERNSFYKKKISSSVKRILYDIVNCHYRDDIKKVYLEGKILELTAVYANELISEHGQKDFSTNLSSCDIASLYEARKILDEYIVSPPTIDKLARLVCLNEYKLKKGFKELFGMPVHAYTIDKRLEMVRCLIEDKKLRVTKAVLLSGYSDASHFAEKFRKKYGVNPSEYIKDI